MKQRLFFVLGNSIQWQPSYTLFKSHHFHSLLVFLKKKNAVGKPVIEQQPYKKPGKYTVQGEREGCGDVGWKKTGKVHHVSDTLSVLLHDLEEPHRWKLSWDPKAKRGKGHCLCITIRSFLV